MIWQRRNQNRFCLLRTRRSYRVEVDDDDNNNTDDVDVDDDDDDDNGDNDDDNNTDDDDSIASILLPARVSLLIILPPSVSRSICSASVLTNRSSRQEEIQIRFHCWFFCDQPTKVWRWKVKISLLHLKDSSCLMLTFFKKEAECPKALIRRKNKGKPTFLASHPLHGESYKDK